MPTLVIQTTSGALAPGSSLHQMPCHASSIDREILTTLENMSRSTAPVTSSSSFRATQADRDKDQNNNNNSTPDGATDSLVKVTKLNLTWTHRYVSPDFRIHGENFDQHLHNLLMPSERRIVKRAMEAYETNKGMLDLLQQVNTVLDNPHKWPVWYFVVQSMKGKERGLCRRMLADFLQSQTSPEIPKGEQMAKTDEKDGETVKYQSDKQDNQEESKKSVDTGKTRIRRRRTMRAAYNREEPDSKLDEACSEWNVPEKDNDELFGTEQDGENKIGVRRTRRRRTFSGIDLSRAYEIPHSSSDILRIEEPEDKETHLPADGVGEENPVAYRSLRQRRRKTNLRLQSAESLEKREISLEKDAIISRNSLPVEYQTGSLRERRRRAFRRSLDGAAATPKDAMGSHDRAALVVKRKSAQAWAAAEILQETRIDTLLDEVSPRTEETDLARQNATDRRRSKKSLLPESRIDDVVISENGNNNNANSLYIDEEDFDRDSDTEDSEMSSKSPLSMRFRASFRLSKSKNKDLTELKAADSSNASSNEEKPKSKKSGLLGLMGRGKKQQSGSESSGKDESKSRKLFGKKSSSKKDSGSGSKSKTDTKSSTANRQTKSPSVSPPAPIQQKPAVPQEQIMNTEVVLQDTNPSTPDNSFLIRNSEKRLTFSRPPKNSDTEAFLTELSAQFDDGFNILDDLAQALLDRSDNATSQNFGAKWSYLPNGGIPGQDNVLQTSQTSDLSELNLSDIEGKKDEIPPFPLISTDSGDESGLGTLETLTPPSPTHHAYRDRELAWERERLLRKQRRRQDFASLTTQPNVVTASTASPTQSSPGDNVISQSKPPENSYHDDENIYDVPKTRTRSRRSLRQANRSESVPAETSYPPNTRFTRRRCEQALINATPKVSENYLANLQAAETQTSFSAEQSGGVDKAVCHNGVENCIENAFSEAEEAFQSCQDAVDNPFPVDDDEPPTDIIQNVTHEPTTERYVFVDDDNVYATPRSEHSTAVRLRNRSQEYPSNGILQGDLSFTDISSLLKECDDEEEEEKRAVVSSVSPDGSPAVPPPPPPPPPIPPPCHAPPLPLGDSDPAPPTSPTRMNVKRLNWQKINPQNLDKTVWGQIGEDFDKINDVVKYLDLEQYFATRKARDIKRMSLPVRSNAVSILSHKKAYNTSILLAHLKMTVNELRGVLLSSNAQKLDSSQYKQLLLYAPDDDEAMKLLVYAGDVKVLNEADQFARRMVTIPGYRLRLQALMYKQGFRDLEDDVRKNLECLQNASLQLRKSKNLAKILEFVLAMGNYMNRGHNRIAKATGFKIQFLADMDSTKTSDNKLTFLHILARAVYSKFPELCAFAHDLKDVRPASKVVYPAVFQELQEMRKEWVEIRDRMPESLTKHVKGDRFKQTMESFLVQSNGSLKRLELLLAATMKEFNKTARYFGENSKNVAMQQFFTIFGEFINKFEKADMEIKSIMQNKATNSERNAS